MTEMTDEELLERYAHPSGGGTWALHGNGIPRSVATTVRLIRAYLALGLDPSDTFTTEAFTEIVERLVRLEGGRP